MSSFFTTPASQKKRKRSDKITSHPSKKRTTTRADRPTSNEAKPNRRQERDDSISGSDSDLEGEEVLSEDGDSESSDDEDETAAERRLRLAERYLDGIKETIDPEGFDAADVDRDLIAERLQEDVAEAKGKVYRIIASELSFSTAEHTTFGSDQFALTAVAVAAPYAYTVAKDLSVSKWELADPAALTKPHASNITPRRKPKLLKTFKSSRKWKNKKKVIGHHAPILCAAVSQSGKFLATGGEDKKIVVWDTETLKPIKVFTQHRDTVCALSFRRNTHTLYSASADRTIKIWNLDVLTYVETLFGHEDRIVDIVGLAAEKCVSVGARDRSARLWKVIEESQLVFRGGGNVQAEDGHTYAEGSIDTVAMIDEDTYVTGSDNGSLCLWSVLRKKPIFTLPLAHGADPFPEPDLESGETMPKDARPQARWITALTTVPYSDLILSGSWDGYIRAWKISEDKRRLYSAGIVGKNPQHLSNGNGVIQNGDHGTGRPPIKGLVNSIAVFEKGDRGKDGLSIIAAVSKEHRLGKWEIVSKGKGRCEGIVFEVGRVVKPAYTNGTSGP
jgi:ribosomal RNA-processing protein 9